MKSLSLALGCSILILSVDALASAPSKLEVTVAAVVKQKLLDPLHERERERGNYSRVPRPPLDRKVRVLDSSVKKDKSGAEFVTIAIDAKGKRQSEWKEELVGCVYLSNDAIFWKRGDSDYRSFETLLGKKSDKPADTVCQATSDVVARR